MLTSPEFDWATFGAHFNADVAAQTLFRKRDRSGYFNLSSNELFHPALAGLFEEFAAEAMRTLNLAQYPIFDEIAGRVCDAAGLVKGSCGITPGSDLAIRALFEAFGAARRVVVPVPAYRAYREYALAFGLRFRGITYADDGFPLEQIKQAIIDDAPCIFVLTNPDGFVGRRLSLSLVDDLAATTEHNRSLCVIDEAYAAFASIDHGKILERHSNVILVRTLSKAFGAAGIRIALVLAHPRLVDHLQKTRIANGVSSLALFYLKFALSRANIFKQIADDIVLWRDEYRERLSAANPDWGFPELNANFFAIDVGCVRKGREIVEELTKKRIIIKPLFHEPGCLTKLRVTVAPPNLMAPLLDHLSQ